MPDDAAYCAANFIETAYFLLTAEFTIKFLRPVGGGILKAEGRLKEGPSAKRFYYAEAWLYHNEGKMVASGNGRFARSRKRPSSLAAEDEEQK